MFTRADYDNYFDQIARVERKMIYRSYELDQELDDEPLKRILKRVGEDEVRHYGFVLQMLRDTGDPGHAEKRRATREYCLGMIQLRDPEGGSGEAKAYCVNLSEAGICLESISELRSGRTLEMVIRLFGGSEAISKRGKVVWAKEVEPGFYISGIQFDA